MQKGRQVYISKTELSVAGWPLRIARLSHEWFEFPEDPLSMIRDLKLGRPPADIFTFLIETTDKGPEYPFHKQIASASILRVGSYAQWLKDRGFKARNKIRRAEKIGVELRATELDDQFVTGVEAIYNESPVRQGRKFWHYGKGFSEIKSDLSSFLDRTLFVGALSRR